MRPRIQNARAFSFCFGELLISRRMSAQKVVVALIALALGVIVGFLIASRLDRTELDRLRSENEGLKKQTAEAPPGQSALSDSEIAEKLAEAEQKKADFQFQKNLGTALYRYAAMKQDADLLAKLQPVVERAAQLGPGDVDVLNTAGNLFFDLAYAKKDETGYRKARGYYQRVLEKRPNDSNVLTDLGLTYFLDSPPDYGRAADQLQKAANINPQDVRALQFGTQALVRTGRTDEAKKSLEKLKAVDPQNAAIADLSEAIEKAGGEKRER